MYQPTSRKLAGLDEASILKDAGQEIAKRLDMPSRRLFGQRALSLGGLSLLTGCSLTDGNSVNNMLQSMSLFNDRVQAWIFDPNQLAPTYPDSMIAKAFPFNAYYPESKIRPIPSGYKLLVSGQVAAKRSWELAELNALPQTSQVTRHICVEGWSAIGKWGGVRFSDFLKLNGADLSAKYVGFKCFDEYYTSIDMPTALHAQTQLTLSYADQPLPPKYGYPMKLRMPTKLGYKNPKHITEIFVTNTHPGGYWEDQGYNWFGGS